MVTPDPRIVAMQVLAERVAFTCLALFPPTGIGARALVSSAHLMLFASRARHGDAVVA